MNAKDERGWTPLHYAARYGRTKRVSMLPANGADANIKSERGLTLLDFAALRERKEVAALIQKHGRHQQSGFPLDQIVEPGLMLLLATVLWCCRPRGTVEQNR